MVYITMLSVSGERIAVRIRQALFRSILQQDMDFFDSHKTGELVSRSQKVSSFPVPHFLSAPPPPGSREMYRN